MSPKLLVLAMLLLIGFGTLTAVPGTRAAEVDWVEEGQMPVALSEFVTAELPDGRLFVGLGYDHSVPEYSDRAYLFDPYGMEWEEVASAPVARAGATCAYLDGTVFVFGGRSSDYLYELRVHMYDVTADEWSVGPSMPADGMNIQCAVIGDHQILVVGLGSEYNKCYSFDTDSRDFTVRDVIPGGGRRGAAMVSNGDELLLFGGFDNWDVAFRDVLRYDIKGNDWSYVTQMPVFLTGHTALMGSDGLVYIAGGSFLAGRDAFNSAGSSFAYDTVGGTFIELPELSEPFRYGGGSELKDGRMLFWGGNDQGQGVQSVRSLQAWEMDVSLSSDSVPQGGSVWLNITLHTSFAPSDHLRGRAVLSAEGVSCVVHQLYSAGGSMHLLMTVPEYLPASDYLVEVVGLGLDEGQEFQVEPMPLTVLEEASAEERLEQAQQEIEELKDALAGKMDAWVGYAILGIYLVTLLVVVLMMVRKR